jgi:hypothetical protein
VANPAMARGAKSKANLKRGGSKGRPKVTAEDKEVRRVSKKLLNDPQYRKRLLERLREGSIQPGVEAMLWYYAHGKPQETIETKNPTPVKLVMEYAKE